MLAARQIWQDTKSVLKRSLPEDTYNRWISNIVPVSLVRDELVLGVSDDFFAEWLREHFSYDIGLALREVHGAELRFKFEAGHAPLNLQDEPSAVPDKPQAGPSAASRRDKAVNCRSQHTFENFVVGDGNNFAYSAAVNVSKAPGKSINPLFIYGGTGLGKTHLLQAIANAVTEDDQHSVVYITCEEFLISYIDALQNRKLQDFRNRFRMADLLLIDDIHFLAKKTQIQEEFFNTFNALHNQEKQIVLTSDRPPSEIDGLESRMVSRFASGLTVDIQPLSSETRLAILRKKLEDHPVQISDDVLYFVADRVSSNIRTLEGALVQLTAFASLTGQKINLALAETLLSSLLTVKDNTRLTIDIIQKRVAEYYDLRVADLNGPKRPNNIVIPRMLAMYITRKMTDKSLPEIGEAFGGRGHATVLHAVSRIEGEINSNKSLSQAFNTISRQLQNS